MDQVSDHSHRVPMDLRRLTMTHRLYRAVALCLIASIFLFPTGGAAGPEASLLARPQQGPPLGGIVLRCPGIFHIYETDILGLVLYYRPDLNGSALLMWWLSRGESLDNINQDLTSGSANTFLYVDTDSLDPKDIFFYKLIVTVTKPDYQNESIAIVYSPAGTEVPEFCIGSVYTTLVLSGEQYAVQALTVQEGGVLEIRDGATIMPPPAGSVATLRCGIDETGGELSIVFSSLFNTIIEIFDGCKSFNLVNSHLQDPRLSINGGLKENTISGNAFSYTVNPPQLTLWNGAQLQMERNTGSFTLQLHDDSRAALTGNQFTGTLYAANEAGVFLEDNVITGTLGVDAYGAVGGNDATITAVSTTLRCDPNRAGGISKSYATSKGILNLAHSRIEGIAGVCSYEIQSSSTGSQVSIGDTRIDGRLSVNSGAELVLYNSPSFQGNLYLDGQSKARLLNNSLFGNDVWVNNEATLTMEDNVYRDPWIEVDVHSKGVYRHNTLRGTPPGYAFDVSSDSSSPDLMIRENCIEVSNGVIIRNDRVNQTDQLLDLQKNWWGHASGPRHSELNPQGQGANIADETDYGDYAPVDFSSYYQTPAFCYDTPPRLPQTASGIITSAGGAVYAPDGSTSLQFPPGAVSQDTRVTYSEQDDSHAAAQLAGAALDLPSTGDLLGVRFFDLTAVISNTGQPVITFNLPFTLTVYYSDAELGSAFEGSLGLYYWNGNQWVQEDAAVASAADNRLVAHPDHMTLFAVLGETGRLYFPGLWNR